MPALPALGHMMRLIRDDEARGTGHRPGLPQKRNLRESTHHKAFKQKMPCGWCQLRAWQ